MNKFAKTLCMMAVVVLAFTSCKKNNQDVKSIPFNGSFEQFQVEASNYNGRAYIDENVVAHFDNGDVVKVFSIDANDYNLSTATNYVVNGYDWDLEDPSGVQLPNPTSGSYYAFYPAQCVTALNLSDENRATFTLDSVQEYRANNIPLNALYMAGNDPVHNTLESTYFEMKNICGVLKVQLYSASDRIVSNIYVADSSINLVGDVTLKIDKVNPSIMTNLFYNYDNNHGDLAAYLDEVGYYTENVGNTVQLHCAEGVALSHSFYEPTAFYVVLRPLALRGRSSITVEFNDGSAVTIPSHYSNLIKPNVIRVLDPIKVD